MVLIMRNWLVLRIPLSNPLSRRLALKFGEGQCVAGGGRISAVMRKGSFWSCVDLFVCFLRASSL